MTGFRPLLLIVGGMLIAFGGCIYDPGIPYQDPTPEMSASYAHHAGIASMIRWFGVAVFMIGWMGGVRRFWPLLPMIGGGILEFGSFGFAALFAGVPRSEHVVDIASMIGWCAVAVLIFGVVAGGILRVKRKPSVVS